MPSGVFEPWEDVEADGKEFIEGFWEGIKGMYDSAIALSSNGLMYNPPAI